MKVFVSSRIQTQLRRFELFSNPPSLSLSLSTIYHRIPPLLLLPSRAATDVVVSKLDIIALFVQ